MKQTNVAIAPLAVPLVLDIEHMLEINKKTRPARAIPCQTSALKTATC